MYIRMYIRMLCMTGTCMLSNSRCTGVPVTAQCHNVQTQSNGVFSHDLWERSSHSLTSLCHIRWIITRTRSVHVYTIRNYRHNNNNIIIVCIGMSFLTHVIITRHKVDVHVCIRQFKECTCTGKAIQVQRSSRVHFNINIIIIILLLNPCTCQ